MKSRQEIVLEKLMRGNKMSNENKIVFNSLARSDVELILINILPR